MNDGNFWYWINERELIRQRKEYQLEPLTTDPILRDYRFCNVFREEDRVTAWIREHWRDPHSNDLDVAFAMAVARVINWPDTLADVGYPVPWHPSKVYETLRARQKRGLKVYTGAYMLRGDVQGRDPRAPSDNNKAFYTVWTVLDPLWNARHQLHAILDGEQDPRLQDVWAWIVKFPGWGGFLAYEVVTDLRWTRWLCDAPDIYTWANAGPGAIRGLNRIHERPLAQALPQKVAVEEMKDLLITANSSKTPLLHHVRRPLEMRDIEHSLCEFDKYERALYGQGKPRAKYVPGRGY